MAGDRRFGEDSDDEGDLQQQWLELFQQVSGSRSRSSTTSSGMSRRSKKSMKSSSCSSSSSLFDLRQGLVAGGWRPKSTLLNVLLDAVSLELAALERRWEIADERRSLWDERTPPPPEDPDATSMPFGNNSKITPSTRKPEEDNNIQDTTDDEGAIFSPQLFPYKNKLKLSKSANPQDSTPEKTCPSGNLEDEQAPSPTPDKELFLNQLSPCLLNEQRVAEKKGVRRQLDLASHLSQKHQPLTGGAEEMVNVAARSNADMSWDESIITIDGTPPPPPNEPVLVKQRLNKNFSSLDPSASGEEKQGLYPFGLGVGTKKKNVWVDQDAHARQSDSLSKKRSTSQNKNKQYKQQSLIAMARNMPKKKVDISTLEEFNGGSRTQSSQKVGEKMSSEYGSTSKRKSDETLEPTNAGKRDKLQSRPRPLSDTSFEVSPIKLPALSPARTHANPYSVSTSPDSRTSNPVPSTSKKPLSPVNTRVVNMVSNAGCSRNEPKPGGSKHIEDFTYNLLKDFDKVPSRDSPPPKFKYKEPTVRKKAERAKLSGWDCDECRGYYALLESQMDEVEIARIRDKCSRHRSKAPVVSNTPENFWCTYIPSTEEMYRDGYINVGTPFTPPPRRRRRNSDSEAEASENQDAY